MAGIAALAVGGLSKASEREAAAATGDPLTAGNAFTETAAFKLSNTNGTITAPDPVAPLVAAIFPASDNQEAVRAYCNGPAGYALYGESNTGFGVRGHQGAVAGGIAFAYAGGAGIAGSSRLSGGIGVLGAAEGATGGLGVRGDGGGSFGSEQTSIGVLGTPGDSSYSLARPGQPAGVYGLTNGSAAGVVGQSNSGVGMQGASNGNVGVLGTSGASHGLYGSPTNGYGVYATSINSTGVVASTNGGNAIQGASNGNVGVLGTPQSSIGGFFALGTSTGLYASGPAAGYAARFDGPVLVNGSLTVLGSPKSATVPHPDGSHRRLYCVESPESWFEDFGEDQIVNGRGRVRLDPDFDVLVRGDTYQVFLTPEGDCKGLYVSAKNLHNFEVRELQGGTSYLAFSYRVVAKRKDIAGPRLERVEVPATPPPPAAPVPPPAIALLDPPRIDPNAQSVERKPR
jgi:hypothetical protein